MISSRITQFDQERCDKLRRIWFVSDVHGEFRYLAQALLKAPLRPYWIVFVGDIDIDHRPFREILVRAHGSVSLRPQNAALPMYAH